MWRKGNPSAQLVGMQIGAATVESSMEIPPKIKRQPTEWGNVFTDTCDKGLISKIYKELIKLNTRKTKLSN